MNRAHGLIALGALAFAAAGAGGGWWYANRRAEKPQHEGQAAAGNQMKEAKQEGRAANGEPWSPAGPKRAEQEAAKEPFLGHGLDHDRQDPEQEVVLADLSHDLDDGLKRRFVRRVRRAP